MMHKDMHDDTFPHEPSALPRIPAPAPQTRADWASLIPDGIDEALFTLDHHWRLTYVNAQASTILGQPHQALVGTVLWEAFPDLIGSTFEHLYRQVMAERTPARLEDFYPSRQAWYDVRVYPIPQGLIVYFQDITAHKQAEAEIQRQAERARIRAEVSQALAEATHDYQTTLTTAAQHLAEIIGDSCIIRLLSSDGEWFEIGALHHRDPQAAELLHTILTHEHYQRVRDDLPGRVVQTGQPLFLPTFSSAQAQATMHSRHWPYFERFASTSMMMVPLRATGQVIGVVSMNRLAPHPSYTDDDLLFLQDLADRMAIAIVNARLLQHVQQELAERIRVEADLRKSEERFKTLSDATNEALFIHDDGRIIEVNERATAMFGYPRAELLGMPMAQLVEIEHLHDRTPPLIPQRAEYHAQRKDGTLFIVEAQGRPIDYHGKPMRITAVRDITDLKQAEEALRKTQAQLLQSQKMESIGQLAGGIAHDFNNLLSVIIGYCEILVFDMEETDPLFGYVQEIATAGQRAALLVRQILAFSRQQLLHPQVVDLNETVGQLDTMLHRVIGEDIELVTLLDPQLHPVLVDPGQVEQVLVNLVVNARDAMPDGGKLTMETAVVELDEHYRSARHPDIKTGTYVMLAVSDTGVGMDEATQEKIFEPFFTTKEVGKGTGLGLATVYGIVRQSEGYIWVYSEQGIGTTFKLYFPIITDPSLVSTLSHPDIHHRTERHTAGCEATILVVEDDRSVQELIHRVVSEAGYTVLTVQNGHDALDVIATSSERIDLVLTDMVMPQMSGHTLVEHLKAHWPAIKIICMSGYTDRAVQRHGFTSACDSFLQKPFTPGTLLRGIHELLTTPGDE